MMYVSGRMYNNPENNLNDKIIETCRFCPGCTQQIWNFNKVEIEFKTLPNLINLPPELWDLILDKLTDISAKNAEKFRLISSLFGGLIKNNLNIKYRILLESNASRLYTQPESKVDLRIGTDLMFQFKQLRWCCKRNDLNLVKWFVKYSDIPKPRAGTIWLAQTNYKYWTSLNKFMGQPPFPDGIEINIRKYLALKSICKRGNLELLQWLDEEFNLQRRDILGTETEFSPFDKACKYGHFKMARWLIERFNLSPWVVGGHDNYLLLCACSHGDGMTSKGTTEGLEIIQWIVERFGLAFEDLRHYNNGHTSFEIACISGRLDIARWLDERFCLSAKSQVHRTNLSTNPRTMPIFKPPSNSEGNCVDVEKIVLELCSNRNHRNQLEIIKWLYKRFTFQYVRPNNSLLNHPMLEACKNGHLDIAKWFFKTFNVNLGDIEEWRHNIFANTCRNGHVKVVKWMVKKFMFNPEDLGIKTAGIWFGEFGKEAIRNAREKKEQIKIFIWLNRKFNLENKALREIPGYYSLLLEDNRR